MAWFCIIAMVPKTAKNERFVPGLFAVDPLFCSVEGRHELDQGLTSRKKNAESRKDHKL
jgi:hypothetical protein